jgi:predicted naringenin-chalcone synthase
MTVEPPVTEPKILGGIVKRSLAMVLPGYDEAIAKAFGFDAATRRMEISGLKAQGFSHKNERHP